MAFNSFFTDYVVFAGVKPEHVSRMPRRCTICQENPGAFEYQRHSAAGRRVEQESGYCCTSCAFNLLIHLAEEEVEHWVAMAGT